jgi:hypothetical protein
MAQAVSRRPPSTEAPVRSLFITLEFVVDKVRLGQVFHEYFVLLLSISFHGYSITKKRTTTTIIIIIIVSIIRLHKKP